MLRGLAAKRPLLVALDDMQWCDPPSLRTLGFALRRLESEHVALVAGLRSGDGPDAEIPGAATRVAYVNVGPLDEAAFEVAVRRGAAPGFPGR